jgi:outer membrane biosynthesis protein TonB
MASCGWRIIPIVACAIGMQATAVPAGAEESLGEKIKQIFTTPTPTPHPRRHKHKSTPKPSASPRKKKHKSSPTPSPSPSPSPSASPTPSPEECASPSPSPTPAAQVATLEPEDIKNFEDNREPVKKLLREALALTKRDLGYTYGSADPENGGMDCSGFI